MPRLDKILCPPMVMLILLSGGCALGPNEPSTPHTFFLNPIISWPDPRGHREPSGNSALLISPPKAQAGFDTSRMAYLLRPYEVSYFAYNQWADTPSRLLHRVIVENLDRSGRWNTVLQTPGIVPAHYRLDCENLVLEQQFFTRPSLVRLALRAQIVDLRRPAILATRSFEVFESSASDDPYGGVVAANHATAKLVAELVAWLDEVFKAAR